MHDIQNEHDGRNVEIDAVGISGLRYPMVFDDGHTQQQGIGEVAVTVRLQAERRGTHMSRMVALVHEHLQALDPRNLPRVLKEGAALLDAPEITVAVTMPVATKVIAPASGEASWQVHEIGLRGRLEKTGVAEVMTTVSTEVTSLCPCSKAISDYGAHNQRSQVTLSVVGYDDASYPLPVGEAVGILQGAGSAPVIPLVKRPDERVLTMQAFDHPVFVEDMARHVSLACRSRSLPHQVRIKNLESIHSHDAIAEINFLGAAER